VARGCEENRVKELNVVHDNEVRESRKKGLCGEGVRRPTGENCTN
jgi:hypothetical protein